MNENTAIIINNLNYSIEDKKILNNINLTVGKGEFVGLIGPNGAGKTTLLKCINGINKANGQILINELELKKIDNRRVAREISMMHQNTVVTFPFNVIDVVLMGRYPHVGRIKGERSKDFEIARENMKFTDTLKLEQNLITNISGGEEQRVFFAKVLTQETNIILLDEPTANLDITHQELIFRHARELVTGGKTVIAAVHDLKIAAKYCTRLVLMKDGNIISTGNTKKVLTPENLSEAYGVNAVVYTNSITGDFDFYIYNRSNNGSRKKIHVIGGGGSASGVIRFLFKNGYNVTTGVLSEGDSDLHCADVFNIESIKCKPFTEITEKAYMKNIQMIKNSDLTILSNMPFGRLNIRNLEAAKHASNLVIIENDKPGARDFTGGRALEIYNELKQRSLVTTFPKLHEVI